MSARNSVMSPRDFIGKIAIPDGSHVQSSRNVHSFHPEVGEALRLAHLLIYPEGNDPKRFELSQIMAAQQTQEGKFDVAAEGVAMVRERLLGPK